MSIPILKVEVPRKLKPLLARKRYKGAYGGRGGAKSHFFAEQLVLRCFVAGERWVCIREVQNTLRESVRQLLADKIAKLGLSSFFDVLDAEIRGANGSLITFRGMQSFNADSIKSLEGYDGAWVEEAQTLSAASLRTLRPTLRKPGSELWFSWNPRHDTDPVDEFFRGSHLSPEAVAVEVNWQDNPWFPDVLRKDMEHDFRADPEMAEHVWGGGYLIVSEGSYYAKLIAAAEREGRVGDYPFDPALPLVSAWDIGVDDYSAVWFIQDDGRWATVVDYYEANGEGAPQIVQGCMPELLPELEDQVSGLKEIGRERPFRYSNHFLPHDVRVREWGAGARSRVQSLMECGVKPIKVGVAVKPDDKIAAVRRLLPSVRFNNTKRVSVGLARLRRYSRKWNDSMQTYTGPLHDLNSHGADAFGEYAMNRRIAPQVVADKPRKPLARPLQHMTMDEIMAAGGSARRERV